MADPGVPRQAAFAAHRVIGKLVGIIVGTYVLVESTVGHALEDASEWRQVLGEGGVQIVVSSSLLWALVVLPLRRRLDDERLAIAAREAQLWGEARRKDFESRLHRALEMAQTEDAAHAILRRTLRRVLPDHPAELLLADSSDAHLKSVVQTGPDDQGPGCPVGSPNGCPSVRRGQTLVFASSEEMDACPHLLDRPYGSCSAVCVPVSVGGRAIGVLHATGPDTQAVDDERVRQLEALATQAGTRIGMLRVMERTSLQAATDSLTGLMNRRTLESTAQAMLARGELFAIAMGDLDHFKRLNDTHGHEVGDRALRLFARTLRSSVRSEDLVCRFGGEEFVILFPQRRAHEAAGVLRRSQEELLVAIAKGSVPAFTASYGVTDTHQASNLDDLLRIADLNLFKAKRKGRDQITVDTGPSTGDDDVPVAVEDRLQSCAPPRPASAPADVAP